MSAFLTFLMRLLALAAGLVLAAGMLVVSFVGAALWLLHSGWARLGGRPVQPLGWLQWAARFAQRSRTPAARPYVPSGLPPRARTAGDVTDVRPK